MPSRPRFAVLLISLLVAGRLWARPQAPLEYELRVDRQASAFRLRLQIPVPGDGRLQLSLPSWSPGRYWPRDATTPAIDELGARRGGTACPVRATKDGFELTMKGKGPLVVTWRVPVAPARFARPGNHIEESWALVHGPDTFLFAEGLAGVGCRLRIVLPPGWSQASPLALAEDGRLGASSYDELSDQPLMLGIMSETPIGPAEWGHRIVLPGPVDAAARARTELAAILHKVCVAQNGSLGAVLPDRYLVVAVAGMSGSIAHRGGAVIGLHTGLDDGDPKGSLLAFARRRMQLLDGKASRPAALGSLAVTGPVRTPDLWVVEGAARWLATNALVRAELFTADEVLERLSSLVLERRNHPLAELSSPAGSSRDAWERGRDDGPAVSYVLHGHLLGFLLDAMVRRASGNAKGLADVIADGRTRWPGGRWPEGGFRSLVEAASGRDLGRFFEYHVEGSRLLPWEDVLPGAGLEVRWRRFQVRDPGLRTRLVDGELRVTGLDAMEPVAVAGLKDGDVILGVGGRPVRSPDDVDAEIERLRPGMKLSVDVRRGDDRKRFRAAVTRDVTLYLPYRRIDGRLIVSRLPKSGAPAGIQAGDVLLKIGKRTVARRADVEDALRRNRSSRVRLTLERGGDRKVVDVRTRERRTWRGYIRRDEKAAPGAAAIRRALVGG